MDQAEAPAVAEAPLVVIEQRPDVIAGQRHPRTEGVPCGGDMARKIVQPVHVAHPPVRIDGVRVGRAVLGHHDLGRCVRPVEFEQRVAQTVGGDVPAHLRLLGARHRADVPVERAI